MSSKGIIWINMVIGSFIAGLIPTLWGAGYMSFSSIIWGSIGALIGLYIGFRLTH